MYQVGRDVQLLFLTGQTPLKHALLCRNLPRRNSFGAIVMFHGHLLSLLLVLRHISRAPNTQKNPTIAPSRLSPSMRRPSLVSRVQFPITGHRLFVRACFQLPSCQRIRHLYTDKPRSEGS